MKLKRYILSKSFMKIFFIIASVTLLMFMIFSYVNYAIAKKSIQQTVVSKQEDVTNYIGLQIKNMNDIVINYCTVMYFNEDVIELMYDHNIDTFTAVRNINRLEKVTKSNVFVESFILYNGNVDEYFYFGNYGEDNISSSIMERLENKELPYLIPVYNIDDKDDHYLTYAIFDLDVEGDVVSALLVNVDLEWLDDLLKDLEPDHANLYLIDGENKEIVLGESSSDALFDQIISNLSDEQDVLSGLSLDIMNGSRYYVNVSQIPGTNWILVNEQEYNHVFGGLGVYKRNTVFILVFVLIISIIISGMLASGVYRPFYRLSQRLESDLIKHKEIKDDLVYLEKVFEVKDKKIVKLEAYQNNTQEIVNRNILLYLLTDYEQFKVQINDEHIDLADRNFFGEGNWCLVSFTVDYFDELTLSREQVDGLKEQIAEYIDLTVSNEHYIKWLYLGGGEFIVIARTNGTDSGRLKADCEKYKQEINGQLSGASVSVFIDLMVPKLSELAKSFINIKRMYEFQIFYGKKCTVTYEDVENRENKSLTFPHTRPLMKALKEGTEDEIMFAYDRWKESAMGSDFEYYIFHVVKLLISLNQTVREQVWGNNKLVLNIQALFKTIFSLNTVEEIEERLKHVLTLIYESREREGRASSSDYLISTVKEYISMNYSNRDLCLKSIADEFNISTAYFGSQFKDQEGISVSKYIHKIRLEKFVEALSSTTWSTKEIMKSVGYDNESNFYKIFKKEFGVTPNVYRSLLKSTEE